MITQWNNSTVEEKISALERPKPASHEGIAKTIAQIFADVEKNGDQALLNLTEKFDQVSLKNVAFDVFSAPVPDLDIKDEQAILAAVKNIETFHKAQLPINSSSEPQEGVLLEKVWRPLNRVGLYIPGGTAPLISTFLMLAVPAMVAGTKEIVIITPPQNENDPVNKGILFVARLLQIKTIYLAGGAQAIAALTFGTKTVPKVDKIFGPGNMWVTEAKKYATTLPSSKITAPAIDMPAGPSEVMLVADDSANPAIVASDLLAQAEHDTMAQAVLVCFSFEFSKKVNDEIITQLKTLPRKAVASSSMQNLRIIICENKKQALEAINLYAPEHLILNTENAEKYVPDVNNAGSIFVGPLTPEAAGDYASGSNHVLPTSGYARSYSGLSTIDFMRSMSVQKINEKGLKAIGDTVMRLANMEGLEAHALSVSKRLDIIKMDEENEF